VFMSAQFATQLLLQQIAKIPHMEQGRLCILRQGPDGPCYKQQRWERL